MVETFQSGGASRPNVDRTSMGPKDGVPRGLGPRCWAKCPRTRVVRANGYVPCPFVVVFDGFMFVKFRLNFNAGVRFWGWNLNACGFQNL